MVPVMGAQPVQASLGAKSMPVANRQTQEAPAAARQVGALMSGWRGIDIGF